MLDRNESGNASDPNQVADSTSFLENRVELALRDLLSMTQHSLRGAPELLSISALIIILASQPYIDCSQSRGRFLPKQIARSACYA